MRKATQYLITPKGNRRTRRNLVPWFVVGLGLLLALGLYGCMTPTPEKTSSPGPMRASVTPTLVDPWTSGNAAIECGQAGNDCSTCNCAYKIEGAAPDGTYKPVDGNIITISNSNGLPSTGGLRGRCTV